MVGNADCLHLVRPDRCGDDVRRRHGIAGDSAASGMSSPPRDIAVITSKAIADRVFPGIVIEAGRTSGPLFTFTAGAQTYKSQAPLVDESTIYDLASLTKVIATATLMT